MPSRRHSGWLFLCRRGTPSEHLHLTRSCTAPNGNKLYERQLGMLLLFILSSKLRYGRYPQLLTRSRGDIRSLIGGTEKTHLDSELKWRLPITQCTSYGVTAPAWSFLRWFLRLPFFRQEVLTTTDCPSSFFFQPSGAPELQWGVFAAWEDPWSLLPSKRFSWFWRWWCQSIICNIIIAGLSTAVQPSLAESLVGHKGRLTPQYLYQYSKQS